jgi:hypothetical protein
MTSCSICWGNVLLDMRGPVSDQTTGACRVRSSALQGLNFGVSIAVTVLKFCRPWPLTTLLNTGHHLASRAQIFFLGVIFFLLRRKFEFKGATQNLFPRFARRSCWSSLTFSSASALAPMKDCCGATGRGTSQLRGCSWSKGLLSCAFSRTCGWWWYTL